MPVPRVALGTGGIVAEAGEVVAYKAKIKVSARLPSFLELEE